MYYSKLGIVCTICKCWYATKNWRSTSTTQNICILEPCTINKTMPLWPSMDSHPVDNLTIEDFTAVTLTSPIDEAYQCPICSARVSQAPPSYRQAATDNHQTRPLWKHIQQNHKDTPRPEKADLQLRHIHCSIRKIGIVLAFVDGWKPDPPLQSATPPPTFAQMNRQNPSVSSGLHQLGFQQYLDSLNATYKHLRQLVKCPDKTFANSRKSRRRKCLETCLYVMRSSISQWLHFGTTTESRHSTSLTYYDYI